MCTTVGFFYVIGQLRLSTIGELRYTVAGAHNEEWRSVTQPRIDLNLVCTHASHDTKFS